MPVPLTIRTSSMKILLLLTALSMTGCIAVRETTLGYTLPAASRVQVGGASVAGEFTPTDGSSGFSFSAMAVGAAVGKRFGPYKFALYAAGTPGQHQSMVVHRVVFRSSRGLSDAVPAKYLGRPVKFSDTVRKDTAQAVWHSPGVLKLDFAADESATVTADVSITSTTGTARRTVTLRFNKQTEKENALINAPLEIIKQAGQDIPFDDLETGANRRGWQPQ
jgi:hypothetical protein